MTSRGPFYQLPPTNINTTPNAKRTRSQVPDLRFDFTLQRSPLKDARDAMRRINRDNNAAPSTSNDVFEKNELEGTDANQAMLKRPSSPTSQDLNAADVKRSKHDTSPSKVPQSTDDLQNSPFIAQFDPTKTSPAKPQSTSASHSNSHSTTPKPGPPPSPSKTFSFTSPSKTPTISPPYIDLSKVSPSPRRASPLKTPKLKLRYPPTPVRFGPAGARIIGHSNGPRTSPLFVVEGEERARDTPNASGSGLGSATAITTSLLSEPRNVASMPETPRAPPIPFAAAPGLGPRPAVFTTPRNPTSRPTHNNSTNLFAVPQTPMSPLTPLPPTPYVAAQPIRTGVRAKSGLAFSMTAADETDEDNGEEPISTVGPSRLPRPSVAPSQGLSSTQSQSPTQTPGQTQAAAQLVQLTLQQSLSLHTKPVGIMKSKPKPKSSARSGSSTGGGTGVQRLTRSASLKQKERLKDKVTAQKSPVKPASSPSKPSFGGGLRAKSPGPSTKGQPSLTHKKSFTFFPSTAKTHTHSLSNSTTTSSNGVGIDTAVVHPSNDRPGSSLSNLSRALEKLAMPPPKRPNTSMGFHRGEIHGASSSDDGLKETEATGKSNGSTGLKRANTITAGMGTPSTGVGAAAGRLLVRSGSGSFGKSSNVGGGMEGKGKAPMRFGPGGGGGGGMGMSRPPGWEKASRKTTLPSVMGSPSKEKMVRCDLEMEKDALASVRNETAPSEPQATDSDVQIGNTEAESNDLLDSSSLQTPVPPPDASLRASLASRALSQSLSALPRKTPTNPPRAPIPRSTSGGYGLTTRAAAAALAEPSAEPVAGPDPQNGSQSHQGVPDGAYIKRSQHQSHLQSHNQTHGAGNVNSNKGKAKTVALDILKRCTIFVDVRTEDGDDAAGLFVDMLRGLGARILVKVGQSCTHIVYKNGLLSTLTRYRLLNEPRPHVVGIAWVVECVEQLARVDEGRFKVDLDGMNVAGVNKRRKSMLPKQMSFIPHGMQDDDDDDDIVPIYPDDTSRERAEESGSAGGADRSMDGSTSSINVDGLDDEHLPPLEKARKRASVLVEHSQT